MPTLVAYRRTGVRGRHATSRSNARRLPQFWAEPIGEFEADC
jgi:hypothetical protein